MEITPRTLAGLAVFVVICFAAAGAGSYFTATSVGTWYAELKKPAWNPPNWLFGPVWTFLYLTMAVAAWLVWMKGGATSALALFAVQLALNVAWSGLFFGLRAPLPAFVGIVLLWDAIALTGYLFWRAVPAAGWLMAPYLAWVTFAGALNLSIWMLNS